MHDIRVVEKHPATPIYNTLIFAHTRALTGQCWVVLHHSASGAPPRKDPFVAECVSCCASEDVAVYLAAAVAAAAEATLFFSSFLMPPSKFSSP